MQSFFILFLVMLSTLGCEDTSSSENEDITSSDYNWTIDTINSGSGQTYMTSMWGTSDSNVYICGFDANNVTNIYHFNGYHWSPVNGIPLTPYIKNFSSISGIDQDYFILAGTAGFYNSQHSITDSGLIVKYENRNWEANYIKEASGFYSLAVISKEDYWAGDRKGSIYHFTRNSIKKYTTNDDYFINGLIALNSNEIYSTAHYESISNNSARIVDYLIYYNGHSWSIIDSNVSAENYNRVSFPTLMKNINGQLYGSGDIGIVKKEGNEWKVIGSSLYGQFNGTSEKNIFLGSQKFGVLHYNGKEWVKITALPYLSYYSVLVFEKTVFLLAADNYNTFIIKGKMKNK